MLNGVSREPNYSVLSPLIYALKIIVAVRIKATVISCHFILVSRSASITSGHVSQRQHYFHCRVGKEIKFLYLFRWKALDIDFANKNESYRPVGVLYA
jgi:hypothetical protein